MIKKKKIFAIFKKRRNRLITLTASNFWRAHLFKMSTKDICKETETMNKDWPIVQ